MKANYYPPIPLPKEKTIEEKAEESAEKILITLYKVRSSNEEKSVMKQELIKFLNDNK